MAINFQEDITVIVSDTGLRGTTGEQGERGLRGETGPQGAPESLLAGPSFTRTTGILTRIDYDDGEFKVFTYDEAGSLATVTLTDGDSTILKTFNYTGGLLTSIDQTNS